MTDTLVAERPTLVDIPLKSQLDVEHLFDFEIHFEPVQMLTTPRGRRLMYVVKHGEIRGPRVNGVFVPGGGDWITVGADRVAHLDVRATIRTDDGELIYVTNTGRALLDEGVSARLFKGELIRWNEMFARSSPLFETGAEKYAWLNLTVTVAINEFSMNQVNYRIYAVK
jgi:Protein of unknown function (DUF3237)